MNGSKVLTSRRERERLMSRGLLVLTALVLFLGLFAQVGVRAQLSSQAKQIAAVEAEIKALGAEAGNLDMNINQHHNLEEISKRAIALGMEEPDQSQLRAINLPVYYGNTTVQTASNGGGEEMNG